MPASQAGLVDQDARRARARTVLLFAATGFAFGTWAARIPDVQQRLALSPAALALVFGVLEAGAVVGLPLGGVLVSRLGSRWCLRTGAVLFPLGLAGVALAPSLAVLAVVVAGWAAVNSVLDVALNAQGLEVERRLRRPALSGLHAGHSGGLLAGAVVAVAAVAIGLGPVVHLVLAAAGCLAAGLVASRRLLDEPRVAAPNRMKVPDLRLLPLGAIAFCVFALEGTANSWSALHLRELGAVPALATLGYAGFAGAVVAGRVVGDRLRARLGPRKLVPAAGALAVVAATVVVAVGDPVLAAVGWTLLGLAVAPLAPTVLAASTTVSTAAPAEALATTTTLGYLGSFTAPPVIGLVAARSSVATGLLALVPAALGVALLSRPALHPRRATPSTSVDARSRAGPTRQE